MARRAPGGRNGLRGVDRIDSDVDVDVDSKPLRQLGDDAEHAEDGFDNLNQGLKKLDAQFAEMRKTATRLGVTVRPLSVEAPP